MLQNCNLRFGLRTTGALGGRALRTIKRYSTDVGMVRILNVAEKNDAAKSLSDIMSAGRYTKVIVFG